MFYLLTNCLLQHTIQPTSIIRIDTTNYFDKWFAKIKNRRTKMIIGTHIERMADNNFGVIRSVGQGVWEKKLDCGPGYRLYFCYHQKNWLILLCGGDKSTQKADIKLAQKIKKGL